MNSPQTSASGMIPADDLAALLQALSRLGPDVIRAVAMMLQAAMQGRSQQIDVRHLGIDPDLMSRVLSAAGASQNRGLLAS